MFLSETINGIKRLGKGAEVTALRVYLSLLEFAEMVIGSAVEVVTVKCEEIPQLIIQIKHQTLRLGKLALRLRSRQ